MKCTKFYFKTNRSVTDDNFEKCEIFFPKLYSNGVLGRYVGDEKSALKFPHDIEDARQKVDVVHDLKQVQNTIQRERVKNHLIELKQETDFIYDIVISSNQIITCFSKGKRTIQSARFLLLLYCNTYAVGPIYLLCTTILETLLNY